MSLINEMLKKIQENEAKQGQANQKVSENLHPYMGVTKEASPTAKQSVYNRIVLNMILLISLIILTVSLLPRGNKPSNALSDSSTASNLMQKLKVEGNTRHASAIIGLNLPAVYEIKQNYANNSFEILFNSVKASSAVQPVEMKNNLIRKVSIRSEEGNRVRLVFSLMPGATIHEIQQMNRDHSQLRLVFAGSMPSGALKQPVVAKTHQSGLSTDTVNQLLSKGDFNKAEALLKEGLNDKPHYLPYVKLWAEANINQNKLQKALEILHSEAPSIKSHPDYYGVMASLEMKVGKPENAVKIYNQLIAANPNKSLWWFGLGASFDMLGKNRNATYAYQQAQRLGNLPINLQTYVANKLKEA